MYDPSIGQESLTSVDVIGVLVGHVLFGIAATLFLDWSWIPLSPEQKKNGLSLKEIKGNWGWDEKAIDQTETSTLKNENSSTKDNKE